MRMSMFKKSKCIKDIVEGMNEIIVGACQVYWRCEHCCLKSKMKMKVFQDADDDESIVGVRVNAPFLWVGSHALPLWTSSPQLLTLSSEYLYTWYYNMYIITIVNKPSIAPTIVNFESWNTWALELANWQTCRGATIVNSNLNIEKLNLWTAMSQH